ncbi:tetratricopeptide repeat protein [Myxococcota bacterium]|nr:tetratricopeptide repeat protein [Myxococcota bacterium]
MTALLLLAAPLAVLLGCRAPVAALAPPPEVAARPPAPAVAPAEARRLYLLARLRQHQDDLEGAALALAEARRFDPKAAWLAMAQGDLALGQGAVAAARASWQEATTLDPSLGAAWLRLARLDRARGDLPAALREYEAAVRGGAGWRARAERVELAVVMEERGVAAQEVTAWVESPAAPGRAERRARAEARWAVGDLEGAWEDLDRYLEEQPEDLVAVDLYLALSRGQGHRRRALERLDRARRALPAEVELARRQVAWLDEVDHAPRLLQALDALMALEPQDEAGLWVDRARALLALERPAEALAALDRQAALAADWPHTGVLRARALLALGRPEAAVRALQAQPPAPGTELGWAELMQRAGRADPARATLEALLARGAPSPGLVEGVLRLDALAGRDAQGQALAAQHLADAPAAWARALARAGRREEALVALQALLEEGEDPTLRRDLGALLLATDPVGAGEQLSRAVARRPDDLLARYLLASALLEQGRLDLARAQAQVVIDADPAHADARNLLAWSLVEAGQDLPRAEALARRAVDLAPADAHVLDTLGWTLARAGRGAEALPWLEEALALAPQAEEIAAHLDAARAGVLPAPRWSPTP